MLLSGLEQNERTTERPNEQFKGYNEVLLSCNDKKLDR